MSAYTKKFSDFTMAELKALCTEMQAEYGDACCEKCAFTDQGCCDAPSDWKLDMPSTTPNWEQMSRNAEKACEELSAENEENLHRANYLEAENAKLRIIVSTVEAVLGRKIEF